MKKLILTVCHGNMQRSVIAEHCINRELRHSGLDDRYRVLSRGTQGTGSDKDPPPKHKNLRHYENEWLLAKPVLEKIGVNIPIDQEATPIDAQAVEEAAIIIVMERAVLLASPNSLVRQFPSSGYKMRMFTELENKADDIADLYGQKNSATVRREILRIDSIVKTHFKQLLALAETLTV